MRRACRKSWPSGWRLDSEMKRGVEISGGIRKGFKIRVPAQVRPTQALVKRSFFDRLGPEIQGARVLDLFAGSGAVGMEALSRGAKEAWFVERSNRVVRDLKRNLAMLGFEDQSVVIHGDALKVLQSLADQGQRFDLVFADPPYHYPKYDQLVKRCVPVLAEEGILAIETRKDQSLPVPAGLEKIKEVVLGETKVTYYRRVSGEF